MQLREHEAVVSRKNMFYVDPRKLKTEPGYNVRDLTTPEALAGLHDLKNSIIEKGVRMPLTVRMKGDDMFIVRGHRRLTATMMAIEEGHNIVSVPATAEETSVDEVERTLDLLISNSGEPLTPLEQAEVVRRLLAYGHTDEMIAKGGGMTFAKVTHLKTLLSASSDLKTMVRAGEISADAAVTAIKAHGEDAASKVRELAATVAAVNGDANDGDLGTTRKTQALSSRAIKKASGDVTALGKGDIAKLVTTLQRIARDEYEDDSLPATWAEEALKACGIPLA